MSQIDRPGTFRGIPQEWGVSESKNGFPQFVVRLLATEYHDEAGEIEGNEPGTWAPWDYGQEITAFLVLFNDKGPIFHVDALIAALGWDGKSFANLNNNDWSENVIQFRVESQEYEGVTRLKVVAVNAQDADPGRTIKKLDAKDLKDLDAKFKGLLGGTKVAPKSARPTAPASPSAPARPAAPRSADPTPAPPVEPPIAGADSALDAEPASASDPATEPPATPPKPKRGRPKGSKKAKSTANACTKEQAWETIHKLKTESVTDEAIADAWLAAAEAVAPDEEDDSKFTSEQWAQIRDKTLDKIEHLPF